MKNTLTPLLLFKCLADETRLQLLQLVHAERELCVCELTCALALSQPKVSRHLALLRKADLLVDRRQGQWVYYRINPQLPGWAKDVLLGACAADDNGQTEPQRRLLQMGDRPQRLAACC